MQIYSLEVYLKHMKGEVSSVEDLQSSQGREGAVGDGPHVVTLQPQVPEVGHHLPGVAAWGRQLVVGHVQHSIRGVRGKLRIIWT